MRRRCLEQGCVLLAEVGRARCYHHHRVHERGRRPTTAARGYDTAWQQFSRAQITEEPWCHSDPCPYPDAGTPANPLTTDHATLGLVLCRRCNSAKQHADRLAG